MNIYLLTQNIVTGYDTYDSAVVAAETEDKARMIHPSEYTTTKRWSYANYSDGDWPKFSQRHLITVELVGTTDKEAGLILGSFNAG